MERENPRVEIHLAVWYRQGGGDSVSWSVQNWFRVIPNFSSPSEVMSRAG